MNEFSSVPRKVSNTFWNISCKRFSYGISSTDYWKDPDGFTLEHFTDGDLLNESFGSQKRGLEDLLGTHWGPDGVPGQ